MWSYLKFKWHRQTRRWRKHIWLAQRWMENYLERHIYGAWHKLGDLRWMFVSWLAIVLIAFVGVTSGITGLDSFFVTTHPVAGGIYAEGLLGEVRILNPILPENTATSDVDYLIFNGLTRVNDQRKIEPDLAKSWEVSADQKAYTFHLRSDVKWQDGKPFTSHDVAFTVAAIQNPDSRSPLSANWQSIKYDIIDDYTIKFTLPNSYTEFLSNTTVGILPHHLLDSIQLSNLRLNEFSQHPIGTGPYRLLSMSDSDGLIKLGANSEYFRGKPLINEVRFSLYKTPEAMLDGYARKQIIGISEIRPNQLGVASKIDNLNIHEFSLPAYVGLFFNTKSPSLSDVGTRQALSMAINKDQIIKGPLEGKAMPVSFPILPGQPGFNSTATKYGFNLQSAKQALSGKKFSQPLRLVTLNLPEYVATAKLIGQQLSNAGVPVKIIEADIVTLQQNYVRARNFDMLLYGQNVGLDSDVYGYWHSSQAADPGLNVSSYKSAEADKLLEGARLSRDPAARSLKFSNFVSVWAKDAPAVLLYSPLYLYGQNSAVQGLQAKKLSEPNDRFYGIEKWSVRQERILRRDLSK